MIGETHRVGGIALGSVVATGALMAGVDINILSCAVLVAGSGMGSLIPDIDHKGSMIGKKLPHLSAFLSSELDHRGVIHSLLGLFVFSLMSFGLGYVLENYSSDLKIILAVLSTFVSVISVNVAIKLVTRLAHRRIRAKKMKQIDIVVALVCIIVSLAATDTIRFLVPFYIVGLSVGYLSHLMLDTLNPTGVRYFHPSLRKISLANITTGSDAESFVLLVCAVISIVSIVAFITLTIM